ncbi:MAG: lipoyl synthase [Lentisphaerae bacterium]|nr:lipoyl synthase [Lentisphaerota bacterium]
MQDSRAHVGEGKPGPGKPAWLRVRLGGGPEQERVAKIIRRYGLHTVCEEALCPNRGACWANGRATLMILGETCTRACAFCNVSGGRPRPCDPDEPARAAEAVAALGLREVVLTSVTRDDLADGGAAVWADTIRRVHAAAPGVQVEVLVPDFGGSAKALDVVLGAGPEVLGHNLETVRALYPAVRPGADYDRSLALLRRAHEAGFVTKTGIMVGLGERPDQVSELMRDAVAAGVEIFTAGQYLQPARHHLPVAHYVSPEAFAALAKEARAAGFQVVTAEPLVRSSYYSEAQSAYVARRLKGQRTGRAEPGAIQ